MLGQTTGPAAKQSGLSTRHGGPRSHPPTRRVRAGRDGSRPFAIGGLSREPRTPHAAPIELLGAIYDAAADAIRWTEVGEQMRKALRAQRVYLGIPQTDGTLPNLLRLPDADDIAYATHYHKVDPFRAEAARAWL
jgi:hypothetical protein